ncbi:MAG TPA: sulfotransferase domain-containing protein [Terriglobia bacterium]|nr:sulfotransferase domain-containing protein [Terriglobia bacterium]
MPVLRQIRHKIGKSGLRAPLIWLRHRGLDSRDVMLASYPRSGSTWTRFVLAEIFARESSGFDNVNHFIPEMGIQWPAAAVVPGGGRLIKTHEPYRKEYKRAIYLVRDGRDAMFSQYSREKELGIVYTDFDGYLLAFLQGKIAGYGGWHQHINSWLDSPLEGSGDLLVIRFEEMRKDMETAIAAMLDFLAVPVDAATIRDAVANNTLDQMRKKENAAQKLHKSASEEGRFVRKGAVAGWRDKLTERQMRLIDEYAGRALSRMGYPLGSSLTERVEPVTAS